MDNIERRDKGLAYVADAAVLEEMKKRSIEPRGASAAY